MRTRPSLVPWLAGLVGLALLSFACVLNPTPQTTVRHRAAVAADQASLAIFAIDDAERALYAAGKITPAAHKAFSAKLLPVLEIGRDIVDVILAWKPGAPAPEALRAMIPALDALTKQVLAELPGDVQPGILSMVTQVYQAVAIVLTFMIGGA